jgi:hypothetical protein
VEKTVVGVLPDGTQIWRIFHNGVDTHPIHVHLFTAQLINRIGQDGQWYDPSQVDPSDLGWKETFKVNPLEVTYLAMRPTVPTVSQLPFEVPDSKRLIDPTLPLGATLPPPPPAGWFDPDGVAIPEILNHEVNFGWEYVWHCHILSHEEMDMMHSLVFAVPPRPATWPLSNALVVGGNANNPTVTLSFIDNSIKETGFTIQRASDLNFTTGLTTFPLPTAANSGTTVTYTDTTVSPNATYWYRVYAIGEPVGDTQIYPTSPLGFPTMAVDSVSDAKSIVVGATAGTPTSPTNLTTTLQTGPKVSLTWRDNATNETGFSVERCTGAGCTNFAQIAVAPARNNTGNVTYVDTTVTFGNTYLYRVAAVNSAGLSLAYSPVPPATVSVTVPAIPPAPPSLTVAAVKVSNNNYTATLNWTYTPPPAPAPDPLTGFTIQRATNATFTTGLNTVNPAAGARSLTQNVSKNTTYYYRIRANNNVGGSSAWTNALPFPIRTGP